MRIAEVAPLYESVPPRMYGGTERVVSYLTEELVRQGHEVTLFASGDSQTAARLISPCLSGLRLNTDILDPLVYHMVEMRMVMDHLNEFDVIHYHIDYLHYLLSQLNHSVHLTTLHGRLDLLELQLLYTIFSDIPVISISNSQRIFLPQANWQKTVYHGLPPDLLTLSTEEGRYLAFLGRISPEKRVDHAIAIAKKTGIPLKVAAKVDKVDRDYYTSEIEPLMRDPLVEFIGEIRQEDKNEFLGNALALLFPINWPEPFGLVMIEAMACGTPVIAFAHGSVREIIDEGITGYAVHTIDEAADAVLKAAQLDRRKVRAKFEERFTVETMAEGYLEVYRRLIEANESRRLFLFNTSEKGTEVVSKN